MTDSGVVVRATPDEIEFVSATKKRAISRSAHAVCALDGDVVAGAFDDEVVLFDAVEGRPIHRSFAGGARRLGRASTPSVLLVSDEGRAAAFDWRSGEEVFVWDGPERPETFDVPSRERVVLADSLGEVCVFALARG